MRIFLLLLLFLSGSICYAKDKPNILPEPSWLLKVNPDFSKKPDLRNVGNGYYLELYDEQINITNQTVYTRFTKTIVNETGIQNASEVSVTFVPEYQMLTFHFVRVIRNGTVVNHLNAKDIKVIQEEQEVAQYQYNGHKRAFLILKDIRKEDRIEASYSITGFNPVFNNKFTWNIGFINDNPILNYYQTIICESTRKLNFSYYKNCPKPAETITGNIKTYHWNNPAITLWQSTTGTPSWFYPYPYIAVSEFNNWNEVANWGLSTYNNYNFTLPTELKTLINSWRKQSNEDDDEFARLALRYVQDNIRYLGLEIGVNTHKPHSPSEVFNNRYGDCKDKALLLVSILRSENIQSYAALVNTEARGNLTNYAATPNSFDHVIVAIGKTGNYNYVDPTLTYQRGPISDAYMPAYEYALLIKEGETNLQYIKPVENNIVRIFDRLKVKFDEPSTLIVNTTYRSGKANSTRSSFATTSQKDLADSYEKYYAKTFDGIKLTKDILSEDDTINNAIKVTEEYEIPQIWNADDSTEKVFFTYAKPIDEILTNPAGISNNLPVSVIFPSSVYYTIDLQMPEAWSFPDDKLHIKNDSYEFNFSVEKNGSLITLKYALTTFKDHIPASEVAKFKKDYKEIEDVLHYRISYGDTSVDTPLNQVKGLNFITILFTIGIILAMGASFYLLNRRSVDVPYERDSGYQLGGWTIVLGISIVLGAGVNIYNLFEQSYFLRSSFEAWKSYGNGFVATAFTELAFLWVWALSSVAVAFWYFKRRDIFPRMFMGYVALLLLSQVILYLLYKQYANTSEFETSTQNVLSQIFKLIFYGAIWCTYIVKSERVKGTFLKGYRS